eukprot:3170981-Pleurochrysis_carterae.AAC.1
MATARRGRRRSASDPGGHRTVRAAQLRRGASGVYGRRKNLKSAHTSGTYPAVGEDAAWTAGASRAEHSGARTAEQLGAAAH